jgi:hypothetical protein
MHERALLTPTFRHLCVIAREQFNPTITDAEWKARILERLARLGFTEPDRMTLSRALSGVERAIEKRDGPRPIPMPPTPPPPQPSPPPLSQEEARQALQRILQGTEPSLRQKLESSPSLGWRPNAVSGQSTEQANQWRAQQPREQTHARTPRGWAPIKRSGS